MKNQLTVFYLAAMMSCGGPSEKSQPSASPNPGSAEEMAKVDDGKGIGEITEVKLNNPLDQDMIKRGQAIADMKCAACPIVKVGPAPRVPVS
jgi:hypothetical protein